MLIDLVFCLRDHEAEAEAEAEAVGVGNETAGLLWWAIYDSMNK
jgi:hypothetical protein